MDTSAEASDPVRFGAELRRLRLAAGLSLAELATAANYSKGQLSKAENGVVRPNHGLARACDIALGSGHALRELVPTPRRPRSRSSMTSADFFSGLPRETRHFTGRRTELSRVVEVLLQGVGPRATPRICVVHGMAGVGKTTLAVRAARELASRYPDGQLFIDLHGHTPGMRPVEPAEALDRWLRRLGVGGENVPAHVEDRAGLFRERVARLRMLLIIDNVTGAAHAEMLMPATSECSVLITSRQHLTALDDAVHVGVGEMSEDEARTLFHAVSRDHGSAPVTDETATLLVNRCGLLPLTIRMAAARLHGYGDQDMLALADRLATNEVNGLTLLDRGERGVSAMFETSSHALDEVSRETFAVIAQHPGADVDQLAAAAAAGLPVATIEAALDVVCDAHLLQRGTGGRFRLHDLVREYARGLLAPDDAQAAHKRLVSYYAMVADRADWMIAPHRFHHPPVEPGMAIPAVDTRDAAVRWMQAEFDNLGAICRLASERGMDELCWRIAYAMQGYSFLVKAWDAWSATHAIGLAAARRLGDGEAEGHLLNGLGLVSLERHDPHRAEEYLRAAHARFAEVGNELGMYSTRGNRAWLLHHLGDHEAALRVHNQVLAFLQRAGTTVATGVTLRGIAVAEAGLGRFDDAVTHLTQALRIFTEHDVPFDRAMALNCLGEANRRRGATRASATAYRGAIDASIACGSRYELARGLEGLAAVTEDRDEAPAHLREAYLLYRELGAPDVARLPRVE